jgi:hypothetical protein
MFKILISYIFLKILSNNHRNLGPQIFGACAVGHLIPAKGWACGQLSRPNLWKLVGYCCEGEHRQQV